MESRQQFPLKNSNSFNVQSISSTIYQPKSLKDLKQLPDLSAKPFYILGEGSNTLFTGNNAPIIIKPEFKGLDISETDDCYIVSVGASENWHELVCKLLEQGIYGLENLALIPGTVGAAPVQNIGAYGVELADFCHQVKWFEFKSQTIKALSTEKCKFSYRNSIFKQSLYNKGVITEVVFKIPKKWQASLAYAGLNELPSDATAAQVMAKVINLRQAKLPDPNLLPNAGSFFKNPIISEAHLLLLRKSYPNIPYYPQDNGEVKIAAGWLIEQTGMKGYRKNGVGVHEHQALVLVNYNSDNGQDVVELAKLVQQQVLTKFDILISPEVRMITKYGEQDFASIVPFDENN